MTRHSGKVTDQHRELFARAIRVLLDGDLHSRTALFWDTGRQGAPNTEERWQHRVLLRLRAEGLITVSRTGGSATTRYRASDLPRLREIAASPNPYGEVFSDQGWFSGPVDPAQPSSDLPEHGADVAVKLDDATARAHVELLRRRQGSRVTTGHTEAARALMRDGGYSAVALSAMTGLSKTNLYYLRNVGEAPTAIQQAFERGEMSSFTAATLARKVRQGADAADAIAELREQRHTVPNLPADLNTVLEDADVGPAEPSDEALNVQVLRLTAANTSNLIFIRDKIIELEKRAQRVEHLVARLAGELGIKEGNAT